MNGFTMAHSTDANIEGRKEQSGVKANSLLRFYKKTLKRELQRIV